MQLEALQIITNEPVVEKKLEQVSGILQNGMDEIRTTIHQLYDDSFLLSQKMDEILHPTWREGASQLSKYDFGMKFQSGLEIRHSYYL